MLRRADERARSYFPSHPLLAPSKDGSHPATSHSLIYPMSDTRLSMHTTRYCNIPVKSYSSISSKYIPLLASVLGSCI